ncbi:metallophosphoesterase family protein [Telluribacter sp.]|jgi:hypothetical protein|uniref:metallophosphoesterase family protein n=1 Tax=Telluribacter sp. TaxID=1978767 RepID=UPI002E10FAC1|nr:metallophosphoesterase [Telluribacter sp.]
MPETSEEKAEKYLDVGHSEAENHARSQQKQYDEHVKRTTAVSRVISEFFKTNIFGFTYHYFRSRFGPRHPYQAYPRFGDSGVYRLQSSLPSRKAISLALLGDWGSDTDESDAVAHLVARYAPDYSIHLGDVYFVGTPQEVEENFTAPHASWYYGASGSLALSGNHEMYSNGDAYFQNLLPAMYAYEGEERKTQQAGFFCLENDHWRIIGLDTGYTSVGRPLMEVISPPDCHLRKEQLDWLRDVVRIGDPADKRGLVLLSHHPNVSSFRDDYFKPGEQICELLGEADRPLIWFWGHDHRLVVYHLEQNRNGPRTFGRCVGHSGMPVEIKMPRTQVEQDRLLYYDRRVRKQIGRHPVGYNGFVMLNLRDNKLVAEYRDIEDTRVLEEEWSVDIQNGQLRWNVTYVLPELAV